MTSTAKKDPWNERSLGSLADDEFDNMDESSDDSEDWDEEVKGAAHPRHVDLREKKSNSPIETLLF